MVDTSVIELMLRGIQQEVAYIGGAIAGNTPETLTKRRERIATACLAGMLASSVDTGEHDGPDVYARVALMAADALIAALDAVQP